MEKNIAAVLFRDFFVPFRPDTLTAGFDTVILLSGKLFPSEVTFYDNKQ